MKQKMAPLVGFIGVHRICIGQHTYTVSAESGKDLAGTFFQQCAATRGYLVTQINFADKCKQQIAKFLGLSVAYLNANKPMFRRMMEGYATDYCRTLDPDHWVRRHYATVLDAIGNPDLWSMRKPPVIVVTDVRFPNEANYIKELGGCLVRVERVSYQSAEQEKLYADRSAQLSESQSAELPADVIIRNCGSPQQLCDEVRMFTSKLFEEYEQNSGQLEFGKPSFEGRDVSGQGQSSGAGDQGPQSAGVASA